jgi:hypothetical protein
MSNTISCIPPLISTTASHAAMWQHLYQENWKIFEDIRQFGEHRHAVIMATMLYILMLDKLLPDILIGAITVFQI